MNFKERALEALQEMKQRTYGLAAATVCDCMNLIQDLPDDEHSGEKTCGPNYEAECKRLMEQLKELTAEKNEAELMVNEAYQQIRSLRETVERLEGFREGVIMGINARNRVQAARTLRDCCNRMEESYE